MRTTCSVQPAQRQARPLPAAPAFSLGGVNWPGHALAAGLCAAAFFARLGLGYMVGDLPMLILYIIPIIVSAYFGGLGAGITCTVMAGVVSNYFLLPPLDSLAISNPKNIIQWTVLLLAGILISLLTESLHRSRRHAEANGEALRKTRNMLSNILESMPSAIIGLDQDGLVTHWNQEAEKLAGRPAGDVIGKKLDDAFPWLAPRLGNVGPSLSRREAAFLEKQPMPCEDQTPFLDVLAYPLVRNGCDGLVLRVDDVTRRVQLEELMVQTEKMRSVGSLAGGMAHEINNPLSGILQSAQNIARRFSPDVEPNLKAAREAGVGMESLQAYLRLRMIPEFLEAIRHSGERAARIVQNMMGFIRQSSSEHVPADLPALVDNTLEIASADYNLEEKHDFRNIRIVREYQAEMPPVPCSPAEIEQVLLNLLRNAAQAMAPCRAGGAPPRITVRVRTQDHAAVLQVEDNGPGMDESVRQKAFEPFFTTRIKDKGAGLGLAIAYFIVTRNHQGRIAVDSRLGAGTTFTVTLPLSPVKP